MASTAAPEFYPSHVSVAAGDKVSVYASAPASPCRLTISRVGRSTDEVARFDGIEISNHSIPAHADTSGCNWPVASEFEIGKDWLTGYYDLALTGPDGATSHHFICVRKSAQAPQAKAVVLLATNTYFSYNYWGGANSYAHVYDLITGERGPEEARAGAIGRLSRFRPMAQSMFAPPADAPRLINYDAREMGARAIPGDLAWMKENRPTPYDGSAGYLHKWEHRFAAWLEAEGYDIDYLTDHDFERGEDVLSGYRAALVVGHSEYWSGNQRSALEAFVDAGGNLAIFSGNTCYWKVRWEDGGDTLVAHKWRGEGEDPLWSDPATRIDGTHLWSHPAFDSPEAALTGLSFLYGGYHRLCMCVARGAAGYTIYDDEHWALEDTDLYYGDVLGAGVPLIGYENDGCPIQFDETGLPIPSAGFGVPENLEIIGLAPATIAESPRSPFPLLIPPEEPETLAGIAFGARDEAAVKRLMRGHAIMASFRRGDGEVFNAGTTEWAHGLAAGDPFVAKITHNVLSRFGLTTS